MGAPLVIPLIAWFAPLDGLRAFYAAHLPGFVAHGAVLVTAFVVISAIAYPLNRPGMWRWFDKLFSDGGIGRNPVFLGLLFVTAFAFFGGPVVWLAWWEVQQPEMFAALDAVTRWLESYVGDWADGVTVLVFLLISYAIAAVGQWDPVRYPRRGTLQTAAGVGWDMVIMAFYLSWLVSLGAWGLRAFPLSLPSVQGVLWCMGGVAVIALCSWWIAARTAGRLRAAWFTALGVACAWVVITAINPSGPFVDWLLFVMIVGAAGAIAWVPYERRKSRGARPSFGLHQWKAPPQN